jgi:predicted transcriptional regulator
MNAIMSIKKEFSQRIMAGEKLYEFRKFVPFKAKRIFIYETSPTKRIVGSFEFEVIKDTPKNLWQRLGEHAGIDEGGFFEYYQGKSLGFALKIKNLREESINPYLELKDFQPPQSFTYTEEL